MELETVEPCPQADYYDCIAAGEGCRSMAERKFEYMFQTYFAWHEQESKEDSSEYVYECGRYV